jgi:lipid-A-disaccharide synthase
LRYDPADIFFVAGEASGDLQASLLAQAARDIRPELRMTAIGGDRLRELGLPIVYDSSELASIGPISVLPRIPLLYYILRWVDLAMRRRPSRLFVPVDAGAFNLRLITRLRAGGYHNPIVYYFPPGAWLDDPKQARRVADLALPLTPFAHQRDFYRSLDLRVEYFGHPLVSVIQSRSPRAPAARPIIAVLPGSRREETELHLPVLAQSAAQLSRQTSASFIAVAASQKRAAQIAARWERSGGPPGLTITRERTAAVLGRADLAWVASGTAVLEAALVSVPQVMFYVVSRAQFRVAQRRLPAHLLKSIALPNLVMRRSIVPELLQDDFTATRLTEQSLRLLDQDSERERMLAGYHDLREALGPPDSLQRIAAFVVDRLEQQAAAS